jgi:hypothetical protein
MYLGGGVGGGRVSADYHFDVTVFGLPAGKIDVVDDDDHVFAYQGRFQGGRNIGRLRMCYRDQQLRRGI